MPSQKEKLSSVKHTWASSNYNQETGTGQQAKWTNNRPEAIIQKKLQEVLNNSPQIQKTTQLQEAANYSRAITITAPQHPVQLTKHASTDARIATSLAITDREIRTGDVLSRMQSATGQSSEEESESEEEEVGFNTDDLARRLLPGGNKVALVGENHGEVFRYGEEVYFPRHGYGYHHEISSYQHQHQNAPAGNLTEHHDANDFAIENIPLRALSEVLDMIEYKSMFKERYISPVHEAWSDCILTTIKMDKLVNTNMLTKLSKKLHLTKHKFITETFPELEENASLFMGPLHSLEVEILHTHNGLTGTVYEAEASSILQNVNANYADFEAHLDMIPRFFLPQDTEDFTSIDELETTEDFEAAWPVIQKLYDFDKALDELLPLLRTFLKKIVSKQTTAAVPLAGTGTDTEDEVTKGRSEAMLNNAIWLANNSTKLGEIVKVGDAHIDDMDGVAHGEVKLNIVSKNDYYQMQDQTNTQILRNQDE